MSDFGSKKPLHMQSQDLSKAAKTNPSWESFKPHQTHPQGAYRYQGDDRPSTHAMSVIRRNLDGTLDYKWATRMVLDALYALETPETALPIHRAIATVILPDKIRAMEPMQATLMTQFSDSERERVRVMVDAALKEAENYNAGRGGGSVEGRSSTKSGTP